LSKFIRAVIVCLLSISLDISDDLAGVNCRCGPGEFESLGIWTLAGVVGVCVASLVSEISTGMGGIEIDVVDTVAFPVIKI
jgi:hypothetical protein